MTVQQQSLHCAKLPLSDYGNVPVTALFVKQNLLVAQIIALKISAHSAVVEICEAVVSTITEAHETNESWRSEIFEFVAMVVREDKTPGGDIQERGKNNCVAHPQIGQQYKSSQQRPGDRPKIVCGVELSDAFAHCVANIRFGQYWKSGPH